ncbi:MAG: WYL domain-containing protein, partial [Oscillospiraceae bacterium]
IPYSQCKELIEKLEGLSNRYFKSKVKHICNLPENAPSNKQLFYSIEILDEAISRQRQVAFRYNSFGTNKKMHPRLDDEGNPREYIINPYQMVATNGRYYLICNYDKYCNTANYRVDRISNIRLLDTPAKPMRQVEGLENGLDLPKHMAEHIYMFTGKSELVTFRAKKYLLTELFDWFGSDIQFSDETEDEVTANVTVNTEAMRKWALQYVLHTKIISPQSLADTVKNDIAKAMENYKEA